MDASEGFPPIVGDGAKVLVLGSLPGVASLNAQRYYAHPRNAFWPIMAEMLTSNGSYEQCCHSLVVAGVAVWDVLQTCVRQGSLDASMQIDSAVANDFNAFLTRFADIELLAFNGKKAEALFRTLVLPTLAVSVETVSLPSTSPAFAAMPYAEKSRRWQSALRPPLGLNEGGATP